MFEFFSDGIYKDGSIHINPGYWDEKLTSGREAAKDYSKDCLLEWVREYLEQGNVDDPDLCADVQKDLRYQDDEGMLETLEDAQSWLRKWEHGGGIDGEGVWSDTWEIDLQGYDWWYLWACHAICWGIKTFYAQFGILGSPEDVAASEMTGR
jgi:hypothetical protein